MRVCLKVTEKKLGNVLRKYRVAHNITQKKVAEYLDIDRSTYSKYETIRKPELDVILKLVAFYDVSLDDFLKEFFVENPDEISPLSAASAPSFSESDELFVLNDEEKQLLFFYRDSIRKKEILNNAREVWLQDAEPDDEE